MQPDLAVVVDRLDDLGDKFDSLADDLRQPPRDGKAGGMLFRMADAERRLAVLEDRRDALKLVALNVLTALLGGTLTAWVATHLIR